MDTTRICDYCPNTTFSGKVCPSCGYDYTGVYPDIDAAEANAPLVVRELVKKATDAGLLVEFDQDGAEVAKVRAEQGGPTVAMFIWDGEMGTRAYLQDCPGRALRRAAYSHVARRFDETKEEK